MRKKQEIQADIEKREKQLSVAKGIEKNFIQKKLSALLNELDEVEKELGKSKKTDKPVGKKGVGAITKKLIDEKELLEKEMAEKGKNITNEEQVDLLEKIEAVTEEIEKVSKMSKKEPKEKLERGFKTFVEFEEAVLNQMSEMGGMSYGDADGIYSANSKFKGIVEDAFGTSKSRGISLVKKIAKSLLEKSVVKTKKLSDIEEVHGYKVTKDGEETIIHLSEKSKFTIKPKGEKWVACLNAESQEFDSEEDAMEFVKATLYSGALKVFIDERRKKRDNERVRAKARQKAGKPTIKTATEVANDELEKVVDKIEDKVEDEDDVKKDVQGTLKSFSKTIDSFMDILTETNTVIDESYIDELIAKLKKLSVLSKKNK